MRSRAPSLSVLTIAALIIPATRELSAQIRSLAPVRTPLPAITTPPSPGTGSIAVALTLGTAPVSLGYATTAQFADRAIPTPQPAGSPAPASGVSTTAGKVTVAFAANDQLASNTSRAKPCSQAVFTALCQLTLTVAGTGGQAAATYLLKGVDIAAASAGSPSVVTFSYKEVQFTFPQAPGPPPPPPPVLSAGTGPLSVAVRAFNGSAIQLGNGTALQFANLNIPTPATPSAASGVSTIAGDVIVTFSAADQMWNNLARGNPCATLVLGMGCQLTIAVSGGNGQNLVSYVMTGVTVNSTSSGSPPEISFNYKTAKYTFPPPPPLTPGTGSVTVGLTMLPGGVVGLGNATAVQFSSSSIPAMPQAPGGPFLTSGSSSAPAQATITFGAGNQFVANDGPKATGCNAVLSFCEVTLAVPGARASTYVLKGVKTPSSSPGASPAVITFSYTQIQYTFAPPPPPPPTPGTGQLTASLAVGAKTLALGTGTLAQFTDPAIPNLTTPQTPGSSTPTPGQSSTAGDIILIFAGNNTLAASILNNAANWLPCNAPLLAPSSCQFTLTVMGTGGQVVATYQLKGVEIAATALTDSPPSATLSYKQIQYSF